jgi:hypothetical protein
MNTKVSDSVSRLADDVHEKHATAVTLYCSLIILDSLARRSGSHCYVLLNVDLLSANCHTLNVILMA